MLDTTAASVLNRLLRANPWALERLQPHAGKIARLTCAPLELDVLVCASGEVTPAPRGSAADVTITVTAGLLLRLAARDEAAWADTVVAGDAEFAAAIDHVRRNLVWDYEEDLSRVFGDIAAHRIGSGVRALDRWGRAAAVNIGQAFAEYATYEQPALASAPAIRDFVIAVDEARDDVERLAKRVELAARRLAR